MPAELVPSLRPTEAPTRHLRVLSPPVAERKFATVLIADVKGSMGLSDAIDGEEWWSVINDLFEVMCESVCRFRGWVGNFTGDGIVAVFESLAEDGENDVSVGHARRACQAALWLRDAIREPADQVRREHGLDLSIRLGLNSGEIFTGTIGDRFSRYYTAAGYAVALARRMEGLAKPGRIYLTEHTALLLGSPAGVLELGAFEVKGARFPLRVFELLADRRASSSGYRQPEREPICSQAHPGTNQ